MKKILSAVLACTATMALATSAFAEDAGATAGATDKGPVTITAKFTPGKDGIGGADLNAILLVDENTKTKYTWADVEEVDFVSENGLFCVGFAADKDKAGTDWFVLGVNEVTSDAPAEDEGEAPADDEDEAPVDGEDEAPADDEDEAPADDEDETVAGAEVLRDDDDDAAGLASSWTLDETYIALFDTTKPDGGDVKVVATDDETEVTATVTIKANATGEDLTNNAGTGIALAVAPAGLAVAFVAVAAVMSKKKKG